MINIAINSSCFSPVHPDTELSETWFKRSCCSCSVLGTTPLCFYNTVTNISLLFYSQSPQILFCLFFYFFPFSANNICCKDVNIVSMSMKVYLTLSSVISVFPHWILEHDSSSLCPPRQGGNSCHERLKEFGPWRSFGKSCHPALESAQAQTFHIHAWWRILTLLSCAVGFWEH